MVNLLGSGTKGFTGMIGAIAAYDKIIDLDKPVVEVLTEWKDDTAKSKITYRHLLTMSSGLEELKDQKAWTDFLNAKVLYPAGTRFIYGPDPNLFGLALQRKLGPEKVVDYMNRRLFTPLGIRVEWRGGFADGNPQLSGGAYVRANEWYKFGEFVRLMLADKWTGPSILPKQHMIEVIASSDVYAAYGFYWWLKKPVDEQVVQKVDQINNNIHTAQIKPIIDDSIIPHDFVMCRGAYGQCLYVMPSLDLVVVRNAPASPTGIYKDQEFLVRLLGQNVSNIPGIGETSEVDVYPNPAAERIWVVMSVGTEALFSLEGASGRILLSGKFAFEGIDLSNIGAGIYILRIFDCNGQEIARKKIVKM
jgi:CubicO group peptidase (beta-lactamase class C family)